MNAMIVLRGLDPSYYFFTEITAKANDMVLIVDRRDNERRVRVLHTHIEQRAKERRRPPPATWSRDGFMVVSDAAPEV
jgi:hypothetical protein